MHQKPASKSRIAFEGFTTVEIFQDRRCLRREEVMKKARKAEWAYEQESTLYLPVYVTHSF